MNKIIMTKGLPASGKTTWAKEQVRNGNGSIARVNKDDLRAMLHNGVWSKDNEKLVLDVRDSIIHDAIIARKTIIVDDTNFAPKHEQDLRAMAQQYAVGFEVKDFTDVSLSTCVERDLHRTPAVGKKVIKDMYFKYLYKPPTPAPLSKDLPDAVICDLDGTIAEMVDRGPYDTNVANDRPRHLIIGVVQAVAERADALLFVSGRKEEARISSEAWLERQGFKNPILFMRANDDNRRDSIVKREIYEREIVGKYNVAAVFDDRPSVCRLWLELGLPLFNVGDGREF